MNKQNEKKRAKINPVWPKNEIFTIIEDFFALNPGEKHVTLRVYFQQRVGAGEIVEIGSVSGQQGRPRKVYAYAPLTEATLAKAKGKGITLLEQTRLQKLGTVPPVSPLPKMVSSTAVA